MLKINYNNGIINEVCGGLREALAQADESAAYTQADIVITDSEGAELARRPWWGVAFDADECVDVEPITFGDFGYYGDWIVD